MNVKDIDNLIDPNLQARLHRAQDAVTEKREQISGLQEVIGRARSALETDRATLPKAEEKLRLAASGHQGNADAIEAATSAARKTKSEIVARIRARGHARTRAQAP
jgi:peptidoglycan hydrolase CwlO-like protein